MYFLTKNNNFFYTIFFNTVSSINVEFFFSNKRIYANETIRIIYLRALSGRSAKVCSFLARKFKKYVRGRTIKKGKKKAKGYETWRKGLTRQSRHVSMPLGGVHGMWSHQPSAFPPPSFAPLSPFLAQTGEFFYPCPFCVLFVHFSHPSVPIRARFTRRGEYSPRISNRPDPVSSPLL